ncbi:MAG: hypothetical protein V3W20_11570 [Candidatus Neomarinimicrobiota bacterium]
MFRINVVGQYNLSIASTVVTVWTAVDDLFIAAVFAIIFSAVVYHSEMGDNSSNYPINYYFNFPNY